MNDTLMLTVLGPLGIVFSAFNVHVPGTSKGFISGLCLGAIISLPAVIINPQLSSELGCIILVLGAMAGISGLSSTLLCGGLSGLIVMLCFTIFLPLTALHGVIAAAFLASILLSWRRSLEDIDFSPHHLVLESLFLLLVSLIVITAYPILEAGWQTAAALNPSLNEASTRQTDISIAWVLLGAILIGMVYPYLKRVFAR